MIAPRFARVLALGAAFGVASGCTSVSSIKPAEALDERTGMTVGSLEKPIELVQGAQGIVAPDAQGIAAPDRRVSFAYLGPIEWDNMGAISYGLWIHLAPGNDWRFDDIKAPGAVALSLDDGSLSLSLMDAPRLAHGPYQPVASWGQTGYFNLDLGLLRRMAASDRIELDFRAGDAVIRFSAPPNARAPLLQYLHARGY
jgi:hypothetical protein